MKALVEALCDEACAGRRSGTPGGRRARGLVVDALRDAGLDPGEQPVPGCDGANVLATVPGDEDRWVLVAAHYDHLGRLGQDVFPGADDNAAAVAILVELGRRLAADRPRGRGVILASFDAEEPPFFLTEAMGSEHFARHPTVPLERIDQMVCMDLVGHAVGPEGAPAAVRDSLFVLGAERSEGMDAAVDQLADATPGLAVRRVDAHAVPPMSDYAAFWQRERPFTFLTNARSRVYHDPSDVPAALAWDKMAATARWLETFVRDTCDRDASMAFVARPDHLSTIETLLAITGALAASSPAAAEGHALARQLRGEVRADRTLPDQRRPLLDMLLNGVEQGLAS